MKTLPYFFLVVVLIVGSLIWEQTRLCIRRQTVTMRALPEAFEGLRLVQLSDLHHRVYWQGEKRLLRAVRRCQPDLIVITGDLVSRDMTDFTERQQLLAALRAIAPVYLSLGNHELDLSPSVRTAYRRMVTTAGCQLLDNDMICLMRGTDRCYLAGVSLRQNLYHDEHFQYRQLVPYTKHDLTTALGIRRGCTILLAHNPMSAESYFTWGADLTLCGHVHGGVVRLPILGGLLSPERIFFPAYSKGFYGNADTWMYVNCGIGKFRLGNPAEVTQLTLRRMGTDTK